VSKRDWPSPITIGI